MNRTAFLLAICLVGVITQFTPSKDIVVPTGTIDIDYSPDQKYLAAASTSKIFVFISQTG